jgi:hypothetical protein
MTAIPRDSVAIPGDLLMFLLCFLDLARDQGRVNRIA